MGPKIMIERKQLEQAASEGLVISFEREELEAGRDLGMVAAVGESLFLVQRISDGMRLNGYSVLRIADLSELDAPHENEDFVKTALRLRGESPGASPMIDLSDMESATRTAGKLFEIVTLHTEVVDPDVCQIGKVRSTSPSEVNLFAIDPDADWDDEVAQIATAEITRIDMGGEYEEALHLVGGNCPFSGLRVVT